MNLRFIVFLKKIFTNLILTVNIDIDRTQIEETASYEFLGHEIRI